MPVPANAQQIYEYLTGEGYNRDAAAGILGNMEQESTGNPEAQGTGGGGLIGWTPESAAHPLQPIVTGNVKNDLSTQLTDLTAWNKANNAEPSWLNQATSPSDAARLYMNQAERPNAALANLANRQTSANEVAAAAKSGNWKTGPATGKTTSITSDIGTSLVAALLNALGIPSLPDMFKRFGLILIGGALVIVGITVLIGKRGVMNIATMAVPEEKLGMTAAKAVATQKSVRPAGNVKTIGKPKSARGPEKGV